MNREQLKYWLLLGRIKGVPQSAVRELFAEVLSKGNNKAKGNKKVEAREILEMDFAPPPGEGGKEPGRKGTGKDARIRLSSKVTKADRDFAERELDRIEKAGAELITMADPRFPEELLRTPDPPLYLYIKGTLPRVEEPKVAIVGTRRATAYGLTMAEAIARDLTKAGVVVVSGLARGCDSAAHRGALTGTDLSGAGADSGAGCSTIAVLGTGIDGVYPKENKGLHAEIAGSGLLVSEFPFGTPPLAQNFPQRNRIISGLSLGVLVVEAPLKSGAMMTVRLALDSGREVFALPGAVTSKASTGTNKLIKDGACLVRDSSDILAELGLDKGPRELDLFTEFTEGEKAAPKDPDAANITETLDKSVEPLHIDSLAEKTGLAPAQVSSLLLRMELEGRVRQMPGKLFLLKR